MISDAAYLVTGWAAMILLAAIPILIDTLRGGDRGRHARGNRIDDGSDQ